MKRIGTLFLLSACTSTPMDIAAISPGTTAMVAVVNPVVNIGHHGSPPSQLATRHGIRLDANPGTAATSGYTGLVALALDVGRGRLNVANDSLSLDVDAVGDILDGVIAFDGQRAEWFDRTPIRYPLGANPWVITPETSAEDVAFALDADHGVVVFEPGEYFMDLEIKGKHVTLYGWTHNGLPVLINGDVTIRGKDARVRGLTVLGHLEVGGDDAALSFNTLVSTAKLDGDYGVYLGNGFCRDVELKEHHPHLLDNRGLPPLDQWNEEGCYPFGR